MKTLATMKGFWNRLFSGVTCATIFFVAASQLLFAEEVKPDQTVIIQMKDGTKLPTDLYLPTPESKNLPCILLRSPAGRNCRTAKPMINFAKLGYLVAVQDTRSAIDLEGKTLPYTADNWIQERDGHETLNWLASSPLTNGKIGTMGFSAMGITQLLMAPFAPDSLKCQYIGAAPASLFHHAIFPSGVFLKHQVENWLGYYAKDPGVCSFVASQYLNDQFWKAFDTRNVAENVTVPAIHQGGWYDTFLQGTIDAFVTRQENGGSGAKGQQKLIIGPWTHFWPMVSKLGDFEVPAAGKVNPFEIGPQKIFDYYLKGIDNGTHRLPAVTYYVMGPFDGSPSIGNVWKTAARWPVDAVRIPFYLTPSQSLSMEKPAGDVKISYQRDPKNLVPTLGGLNLFLEAGPIDQRPIENRNDVILFTTDALEKDTEITGRIIAKLFISPHLPGTTVVLRLTDVYPDGRSILVADGIYRKSLPPVSSIDESLENPAEVEVDLWSTSMVFAKGHRIRISASGSNYPRYEDSLGDNDKIKTTTVHVGDKYPSRIILPIVNL